MKYKEFKEKVETISELASELEEVFITGDTELARDMSVDEPMDNLGRDEICFSCNCALDRSCSKYDEWKKQRTTRGWDDTELWNFDTTLYRFIYPRLVRFKETSHGCPGVFVLSDGETEYRTYEHDGEHDENGEFLFFKVWEGVLDDMIWYCRHKAFDNDIDAYTRDDKLVDINDMHAWKAAIEDMEKIGRAFRENVFRLWD